MNIHIISLYGNWRHSGYSFYNKLFFSPSKHDVEWRLNQIITHASIFQTNGFNVYKIY